MTMNEPTNTEDYRKQSRQLSGLSLLHCTCRLWLFERMVFMYYITVKQSPHFHQMTLEEFLFGTETFSTSMITSNETNTRTYAVERISQRFLDRVDIDALVDTLRRFNYETRVLHEVSNRHDLYREFYIPKKSGGMRKIDAPNDELMDALRRLKEVFEKDFMALYHTAAYAYVPRRSTIDCMRKHQQNESKWFAKFDFSNFFGSTTKEYVLSILGMVFPFSEVLKREDGKAEFEQAIDLAFLDGGLPQGTPISPLITNIIMIPVDYNLSNALRDYDKQAFVYTRYADDIQVSSRYDFDFKKIEALIVDTLSEFGAPFCLNTEKTRYGSSSGSNWNLGLMLNKDNNLTVGHKAKKRLQAGLSNYIMDRKHGIEWSYDDLMALNGTINYDKMVEKDTIEKIIAHINGKFGVDVEVMIKRDLRPA